MVDITPANAPTTAQERLLYVIHESHALPQIDCFRAVKHVLFRGNRLRVCNRMLSRYKRSLSWGLAIGISQALLVPYIPAKFGRVAAFVGLVELPALIAALLSLRFDMIRLLLRTYEFWYLSVLNLFFLAAGYLSYQDARSVSLVPSALSFELLPLQDANFRALRFTIVVFCVSAVAHIGLVVFVNLHLIDDWTSVEVIRYGSHAFMSDNIVSNYLAITSAVLLRNAYRKYQWVRSGQTTTVRCIAYRCRVHLCLHDAAVLAPDMSSLDERKTQMRLVASTQVYDSNKTILGRLISANRIRVLFTSRRWCRLSLCLIGALGLALTCSDFVLGSKRSHALQANPMSSRPTDGNDIHKQTLLSIAGAIATGLFCGFCLSMYQKHLLKRLSTSFDFLLLATNISVLHVSVADSFGWTSKCFALLSSWMWIMWVITMDALTPDLRQALGLSRHHIGGVLVIFVLFVVLFAVELIFLQQLNVQDRSLFRVVTLDRTFHVHVIQFFFSCLLSLLPICCRILWRLYTARHGELILIQGAVEYHDVLLAQKRQQRRVVRASDETQGSLVSFSWMYRSRKVQPSSSGASLFPVKSG